MSFKLTLGSLFDGAGTFPLVAMMYGIRPIWASEIEPFPIRVTEKRLPFMKHYGDISKLNGSKLEPVDIITFGSPCQNLSVAGNRKGLAGEKSSLFYEAIRIIKEMRRATDGKYPRFAVWENVKGAFSSNKGKDFQEVIRMFTSIKESKVHVPEPKKWEHAGTIMGDGYSIAWRLFDAQFWGVPQRRERIYLVADFGSERTGDILFKPEGLPRHFKPCKTQREETTGTTGIGVDETSCICLNDQGGDCMDITEDVTCTLRAEAHHPPVVPQAVYCLQGNGIDRADTARCNGRGWCENISYTLNTIDRPAVVCDARGNGDGKVVPTLIGDHENRITDYTAICIENGQAHIANHTTKGVCSKSSHSMMSDNPKSGFYEADTSRCLDANGGNPPEGNQGGVAVVAIEGNGSRPSHKGDGYRESDVMYTLNTTEQHAVAFAEKAAPLSANDGPKGPSSQRLKNPEQNFVAEKAYGIDRIAYSAGMKAGFNFAVNEEVEPTMVSAGPNAVGHPVYHSSKNSHHTKFTDDSAVDTLVASDFKDPPTVTEEPYYIVRRLTPIECARLQGFPDWWCDDLGEENPSDEEVQKWIDIFKEYNDAIGKKSKPKTANQIRKWLKNPYSNTAVYKMWGNGCAFPNVEYVLAGIAGLFYRYCEECAHGCSGYCKVINDDISPYDISCDYFKEVED